MMGFQRKKPLITWYNTDAMFLSVQCTIIFIKIESAAQKEFSSHSYAKHLSKVRSPRKGFKGRHANFVTREGIFRFIWFGEPLNDAYLTFLFEHYPILYEIKLCVQSFRQIYECGNVPFLLLFIEKYCHSEIPSFKSFVKGLLKDIDAVENSVDSSLSNGFVEGINNKLKMIKRMMYGRASLQLLRLKLILRI